jgi:alpha-mannosidase
MSFAVLPHTGSWEEAGVLDAAEAFRLPFTTAAGRGSGGAKAAALSLVEGLRMDGAGVVLSALRRRADELELRVVAETSRATTATISGRSILAAREVDLLGRDGPTLAVDPDGHLRLTLDPWEIRTLRLRTADATAL